MYYFQEVIEGLNRYWSDRGCVLHQGYDLEVGAGTFNPVTFLKSLGPEPYRAAYVEPSRRPTDGRYGKNPNRLQKYFQYQVICKPSPNDLREMYLKSLRSIGLDLEQNDIRFVHDDWESPTLGAWGLGWEVWLNGMEITQFTYFQQMGGQDLNLITGEITYGLERIVMAIQGVDSVFDIQYSKQVSYEEIFREQERQFSIYNFDLSKVEIYFQWFNQAEAEALHVLLQKLPYPAYDLVIKCSHIFNLLDARGAISTTERVGYIDRIRNLAVRTAEAYLENRRELGYPLLKNLTVIPK